MFISGDIFEIKGKKFGKFIDSSRIDSIVDSIAQKINIDYKDKNPLFLIVLKGSIFFGSDLLRRINIDCEIDTIRARSYGDSMSSSGIIRLDNLSFNIEGRHLIIIEDIVDTGLTIETMFRKISKMNPASLEVVAFLSKPLQRRTDVNIKYIGIEIEPFFVIGYGLDYAERGRHLPHIFKLID